MKNNNFVFITGSGRSGTTMLRNIFDLHNNIGVVPELRYFDIVLSSIKRYDLKKSEDKYRLIDKIISVIFSSNDPEWKKLELNKEKFKVELFKCNDEKFFYIKLVELYTSKRNSLISVDKVSTIFIEKIIKFFPDSKFIHIIRDGREVYASSAKRGWIDNYIYLPILWNESIRYFNKYQKKYDNGKNFFEIKYEDLVKNSKLYIPKLFQFLEVEKVSNDFFNKVNKLSSFSSFFKNDNVGLYMSKHFLDCYSLKKQKKITGLLYKNLKKKNYKIDKYEIDIILKVKYLIKLFIFRLHYLFKIKGYYWVFLKLKKIIWIKKL